ncbi:cytochrome-c peroxidase [Geomonas subterranea]|uniref:cytochrome-c peroxidase n=1 Tax=Geomonas subterranea TaxID=2847989 RepID=UPI001CD4B388|nr:cytochrome-c peroxidase [Geomonas fuzhouensis]
MKKIPLLLLLPLCLCQTSHAADDLMSRANKLFKPIPTKAPHLKANPATAAKVDLGMKLFFDPRLSTSQLISCNTCHNVGLAGADLQETSTGHGWQKGPRNSPTVFNAVFDVAQFWDGRAKDLQTQAKGPVQAAAEMNSNPDLVVRTLKSIPGYLPLFKAAFPGEKEPVSFDNMAKAIEVFEATLLTPDSRFDRFLKGEAGALDAKEKRGLRVFMDKGCAPCHAGTNVGGSDYYPFGVRETPATEIRPAGDTGRIMVTNTESDRYVFKAPSLRNVAVTQPYFHSGKVWTLHDAVTVMGSAQLGVKLKDSEVADTVAFLRTLTGRQPKLSYPLLPPGSDETPHPQLK